MNGNDRFDQQYYGQPRRGSWLTLAGVWALVFIAVWSLMRNSTQGSLTDPDYTARNVTPRGNLTAEERSTIDVFHAVSPSVCYITTVEARRSIFRVTHYPSGTGSGFVFDKDGHIVTNFHVVQGADMTFVTLADKSEYKATIVGAEPDKDIAVLKIDAPPGALTPIPIGTSNDLQVGQKVLAIGNPYGLDHTLTTGVVSALGREIESITGRTIREVIQTDAAINPGNSGGPLLDSGGRLIGVNTQIASPSGASAGIGFAVPVDVVNSIVPDIIRYGKVRKPMLGVTLMSDYQSARWRLPEGILIDRTINGGGAAQAGLQGTQVDRYGRVTRMGDIIISINGTKVASQNQLKDVLEQYPAGTTVTIKYIRELKSVASTEVELRYYD
ncbi:MAG: S1C family serine protease [Phycisphaerae bacterium]